MHESKEIRVHAGVSQAQVAAAAGSTQAIVSQYEGGLIEPMGGVGRRLAKVYGMISARPDEREILAMARAMLARWDQSMGARKSINSMRIQHALELRALKAEAQRKAAEEADRRYGLDYWDDEPAPPAHVNHAPVSEEDPL